PWWVPAPLGEGASDEPRRAALCNPPLSARIDDAVIAALKTAARYLEAAGWVIEEVMPPHLEEAAQLFFSLIRTEEKTGTSMAIEKFGDEALRRARASTMACAVEMDFASYIRAFASRAAILREWQLFFARHPLLLMPVSYQRPLPIDFDQRGEQAVAEMLTA